jgi:hypothetical protein
MATGKIQPEIEVKISSMVSGEIALPVRRASSKKRRSIGKDKSRFVYF